MFWCLSISVFCLFVFYDYITMHGATSTQFYDYITMHGATNTQFYDYITMHGATNTQFN